MSNVVILIKDERARHQIETFLGEMQLPDLRTAVFETVAEFEDLYFRDSKVAGAEPPAPATDVPAATEPNPDPAAEASPTETELRLFSEVHLFIYALDAVGSHGAEWLDHLRGSLRRYNHLPADGLRVILLKYEDDNVSKLDLLHLTLDDLIFLPLDRLVFMQKMQIFLNLPKRVSPSFLFNQEYKKRIEISKITKIERLNDVAIAIRNPVALRKGLPGHFYLTLPGEKTPLEVKGKVLRSEPLASHPGQYVVYFSFFGLTKPQTTAIRRMLQKDPHYKSLLNEDPAGFKLNENNIFLTEAQKHRFGVVVIDRDEHEATQLSHSLREDMDRLDVQVESSYSLFLHRYLDREALSFAEHVPTPTEAADFYAPAVEFTVRTSDQSLIAVTPPPAPEALVLGHPAAELVNGGWTRLIGDRATRVLLGETPGLTAAGKAFEKLVVFLDHADQRRAVKLKITPGEAEGTARVVVQPAAQTEISTRAKADRRLAHLEALVVEADILPPDPQPWIEGLRQAARDANLTTPEREVHFWVVTARDEVPEAWLKVPEILGAFRRPVDLRQMLFSFSENLPNGNTRFQFDNLGWTQPGLSVHVSKSIDLEAISEYGATLRAPQRLLPGTMLYLRKSIFDQRPQPVPGGPRVRLRRGSGRPRLVPDLPHVLGHRGRVPQIRPDVDPRKLRLLQVQRIAVRHRRDRGAEVLLLFRPIRGSFRGWLYRFLPPRLVFWSVVS